MLPLLPKQQPIQRTATLILGFHAIDQHQKYLTVFIKNTYKNQLKEWILLSDSTGVKNTEIYKGDL